MKYKASSTTSESVSTSECDANTNSKINNQSQQCQKDIQSIKNNKAYQTLEHILAENYNALDPDDSTVLPKTISAIKNRGGHRCWHKHSTFLDHLLGVHNILRLWDQSHIVSRVGLLHSAYSNSYVNLALFDPMVELERQYMKDMVGVDSEEIIYLFCIIDRQHVVVDTILGQAQQYYVDWNNMDVDDMIVPDHLVVPHIRDENRTVYLSADVLRLLVVFTMADVADQYFGWQDRLFGGLEEEHSMLMPKSDSNSNSATDNAEFQNHDSMALWPGISKPGLWMSYVSQLGIILSKYDAADISSNANTNPIPPIFDNCTQILTREDEKRARDLYWSVVMEDLDTSKNANTDVDPSSSQNVIDTLLQASNFNPWFFESHVLLAQKYLHINDYENARYSANRALELQMMWGTAYDKRMSFPAWVAWTRVLYQRACNSSGGDKEEQQQQWPTNSWAVNNFGMVDY